MLALLNYIQSLLGKRNLIAFVVMAALSATALELTSLARNAFETFIQKQAATFAEQKAKGEADVASASARENEAQAQLAAEVAANAKFRQLAEAQLAGAGAREKEFQAQLAAEIAANAKFRQAAEAQLAQASAREKEAMAITAAAVAKNSEPMQAALADKTRAEADKTRYEAIRAQMIACAADPSVCNADQKRAITSDNPGGRMYQLNQQLADRLMGGKSITDGVGYGHKPAEPQDAHDKQIEEDCKRRLAGFATMKDHAAIAVTPNSGCSWTAGQPTKQAAVAVVMNQCAKANVRTCSIAFAR